MAEDDKVKYSDIIQPDDSIEKLVKQLGELNQSYETMVNAIRAGADKVVHALKTASGATNEGRKSIDEATASTSRLERAQKELKMAMSDTGKQIAWLKAQTVDQNKATVEQQRYLQQALSSYDRLKSDLKQTVSLYKSLTEAEREDSAMGQQLLQDILNLKNQIKALDDQMKPHIQTLTEVQKAEQKLAYLQSEEGQKLLDLKAKIAEVTAARRGHKATLGPLQQAQQKLAYAQSSENEQLKLYTTQIREANQIAQLNAQIANSAEGSYNRLSAQYALNKIKLNQMSQTEREAADSGKKLEAETAAIYQQMIKLQEATGNYRLSVGHYQRTWDGLGISVSQVVRELPAAAVSLNTFFLGISNNIPMLIDEINKLREQNKALQAEGKETVSVTKSIVKALFSWNTVIVVLLTVLSAFGKEIFTWINNVLSGRTAVLSLSEALENVNAELSKNSASYGDSMVKFRKLADEWKRLGDNVKEQQQWLKDSEATFRALDISISNVNEAESLFVDNSELFITALKLRAKAQAALTLASAQYNKLLEIENKQEVERAKARNKDYTWWDNTINYFKALGRKFGKDSDLSLSTLLATQGQANIASLQEDASEVEEIIDRYFEIFANYTDQEKELLDELGVSEYHKQSRQRGRQPKDATDSINRANLTANKKYQESLTQLEKEELAKRRKAAFEKYNSETAALLETYRKQEEILKNEGNRYEELSEEEKAIIKNTQKNILATVENYQLRLSQELEDIERDRQINELRILEETIQLRLDAVKKGSEEELQLRLASIQAQRQIALLENAKKPASQQVSPELIKAGYSKQTITAETEYSFTGFEQQQALDEAVFNEVKRSETEMTRFKLQQEKARWQEQIKLAEAGALDWSQAQIKAAKSTVKGIDRELSELDDFVANIGKKGLGGTLLEKLGFDDDQIDALSDAVNIVIEQLQSIMDAEVELAKQAVEAAEERVEAAQKAYDAEVEARNNGYANNVATAKKELEQEKKREQEKQKMLAAAQKRQEALNTVTQASSLVTASANLWSSFSSIPIVGPALALAAIATMWTSFAVAKVKAKQVTASQSEEYGEGGLEFLEGGSHASGNDIDLGTENKKKRRMRAEGGEALAIINKKRTRKYKKILPDVVDSLNRGTFEDKYLNAFANSEGLSISLNSSNGVDLSKIEDDVRNIRKQNEVKYYTMPDGTVIMQRKNVKRIIKN
jgi:hypothetical protein